MGNTSRVLSVVSDNPGLFDAHFPLMYYPGKFERTLHQLVHFGVSGILIPGGSLANYQNLARLKELEKEMQIILLKKLTSL